MSLVLVNSLSFEIVQRGSGDPLIFLHGFTGSGASWWPIIDTFAAERRTVAIDLIGHGGSSAPLGCERYAFDRALDDLVAIAAQLHIERATWLGYSMGGRLALGLALRHPNLVSALILESATPGIADPAQRAARGQADEELARHIELVGIPAFVAEWEQHPMWLSQRAQAPGMLERQRHLRLRNRPHGLANSLRGMGQGAQPSLWDRLGEIQAPVLLVAGSQDAKFAGIAARMRDTMRDVTFALAPNAGHAVHLESSDWFCNQIQRFLARSEHLVAAER